MLRTVVLAAVVVAAGVQPALAQQTLNFNLGYFTVRGEDARVEGDVIAADRTFLTFDVDEFNSPTFGVEWLVPLGNFIEAGAGVGFSRSTVPSVYTEFQANDGSEIAQDLQLRIVPIALTLRVLPLGQSSPIQPYIGAGLGIFNWRYSESGDFINFDASGLPVFRGNFAADGTDTGAIVLGGVRFAGDSFSAGGEVRYQKAEGDVGDQFAGAKVDLGGWSYLFTAGWRFGR